jgi:hypothetical protein
MSHPANYEYVKLGMNLEYLRGMSTASIAVTANLTAFPNLAANLPAHRSEATQVIAVLTSVLIQLEEMGLPQSLAAAAEFRAMTAQMEAYIRQNPAPGPTVLQDGFADKLVSVAKHVSLVLKQELSSHLRTFG